MIDEDGITKDLSDEHCAMLQKPPEKEKCDASRICLTPGIQRHKPLLIKKSLKYRRNGFAGSIQTQKVLTSLTGAICHGLRVCEI